MREWDGQIFFKNWMDHGFCLEGQLRSEPRHSSGEDKAGASEVLIIQNLHPLRHPVNSSFLLPPFKTAHLIFHQSLG
jgi:hypothetical protein